MKEGRKERMEKRKEETNKERKKSNAFMVVCAFV